jgi:hypothetical protein
MLAFNFFPWLYTLKYPEELIIKIYNYKRQIVINKKNLSGIEELKVN